MQKFTVLNMIFLLGTTFFSTSSLATEPENSLSVGGQFRFREEGDNKTDFNSDRDYGLLRVRPIIDFKRDSTLDVIFTPQFTRTLGEPVYTVPASTGVNTKQTSSSGTVDPNFNVHEAYADYHPLSAFAFRAGRMVLAYGDEWVIGVLDWNNVGRSFDGARARVTYGVGTTDFFAMKITDNNTLGSGPGDVNFYGIYNSFNLGEYIKSFDVYFLDQDSGAKTTASELVAVGARIASKIENLDYRLEYTKEMGSYFFTPTADSGSAYQYHIEAGYTVQPWRRTRFSAEYFAAGKSYNQLFPTSHGWLGIADTLQRKNLSGFDVAAITPVTDELSVRAKYFLFSRLDSSGGLNKYNGAALGTAAGSSSNSVGSEWDLVLSYQVSPDLNFSGGGALFNAGNYIQDQLGQENVSFYYAQMEVKL